MVRFFGVESRQGGTLGHSFFFIIFRKMTIINLSLSVLRIQALRRPYLACYPPCTKYPLDEVLPLALTEQYVDFIDFIVTQYFPPLSYLTPVLSYPFVLV